MKENIEKKKKKTNVLSFTQKDIFNFNVVDNFLVFSKKEPTRHVTSKRLLI